MIETGSFLCIGMVFAFFGLGLGFYLIGKDVSASRMFGTTLPMVAFGLILIFISAYYMGIESEAKVRAEKSKLDLMSCQQLGDWLVNNSQNSTYSDGGYSDKNYPYAEAKYLVCTHHPIGVPST